MAAEESASPHVVLFPFLGRGHIPTFLCLAGLLHELRPGLAVTLVSTPRLLGSLSLPATSHPVRLHALPFAPADHGLPPGAESSTPRGHIPAFLRFAGLLHELRPGLVVTLVSTPRLLGSLSLPATSHPVRLHALPFAPADHGLPPGAESMADLGWREVGERRTKGVRWGRDGRDGRRNTPSFNIRERRLGRLVVQPQMLEIV